MPQPNRTHPARGNENALFPKLIRSSYLAVGRISQCNINHSFFNSLFNTVFHYWLLAGYFLQCLLTAIFVKVLKPVKAIPAKAKYLARLRYIAQLFGKI